MVVSGLLMREADVDIVKNDDQGREHRVWHADGCVGEPAFAPRYSVVVIVACVVGLDTCTFIVCVTGSVWPFVC